MVLLASSAPAGDPTPHLQEGRPMSLRTTSKAKRMRPVGLLFLSLLLLGCSTTASTVAPASAGSGSGVSTQQGTQAPADLASANEEASNSLAKTTRDAVAALSACDPKKSYMAKETFERDGLILPRQHIDDYPQTIIADQAEIEKAAFNCADPRYLEYSTAIFVPGKQRRIESGMNYEIYRFDAINGATVEGDTMVAKGVRIFKRVGSPETLREPYTYTYKWNGQFWIITDAVQGSN